MMQPGSKLALYRLQRFMIVTFIRNLLKRFVPNFRVLASGKRTPENVLS